jgi:hypothetical protein
MPYGRGYGMGGGFRGAYAAWPYIGRGRGGLPRCGYFFASQTYLPPGYAYNNSFMPGNNLEILQNIAANLKDRMTQIQARISELEQQRIA